ISPSDPNFMRVRDEVMLDVAVDTLPELTGEDLAAVRHEATFRMTPSTAAAADESEAASVVQSILKLLAQQASALRNDQTLDIDSAIDRSYIAAITPTGPGQALLGEGP